MFKQSSLHTHLLTILITHRLINTLFNLLPSNTKLAVYCLLPQKAICNLNQDACEPDRIGIAAVLEDADGTLLSSSETLTG